MDSSIMIVQDNRITMSRYDFTPIEKRCLYYVIKEVRRLYVDRDIREEDKVYQDLFSDMYLHLKPEQLQHLGDEVKDVYNALRKLRNKEIEIDTNERWILTSWILTATHNKKTNLYEVQVSHKILPYLVELASQFTEYNLTIAISLKSTYSQRFYEMCCQYRYKGKFFLEVDKLRYLLKLEDKKTYENTAALKRRILEVAQKELQELFEVGQSDLYFTYRVKDRDKRKIISYWFDIHTRETDEQKEIDYTNVNECIHRISDTLSAFFPRDKKFVKRVIQSVQLRPEIASELCQKISEKILDYDKRSIPPILRYVLNTDYDLQ